MRCSKQARGIARGGRGSEPPGNGTTEEDAKAGPKVLEDAGVLTIKLH